MPTYTINMKGSPQSNAWADTASILAKTLAPDPKGEADLMMAGHKADNLRADTAFTQAETVGVNRTNSLAAEMDAALAAEGLSPEERNILIGEYGLRMDPVKGVQHVGDFNLASAAMPGRDYSDADLTGFQTGAGNAFNTTIGGTREAEAEKMARKNAEIAGAYARNEATIAGDLAQKQYELNHELVEIVDPATGQARMVPRRDLAPDARPVLSDTDAKGVGVQNLSPDQRAELAMEPTRATGSDMQTVMRNGQVMSVEAWNIQPGDIPITTPGIDDLNPDGSVPIGGGGGDPLAEGTALKNQAISFVDQISGRLARGEELSQDEARQYGIMFNEAYAPKIVTRTLPDSTSAVMEVHPAIPAGVFDPRTGALTEAATPAREFPYGEADPTAAAPAPDGGRVQQVAVIGTPKQRLTEGQQRLADLGGSVNRNLQFMNSLAGYDMEGDTFEGGTGNWPTLGNTAVSEAVQNVTGSLFGEDSETAAGMGNAVRSENNTAWKQLKFAVIEPLLRLRSGAATPDQEVMRYDTLAPQPGRSHEANARALKLLNLTGVALANVAQQTGVNIDDMMTMASMPVDQMSDNMKQQLAEMSTRVRREMLELTDDPELLTAIATGTNGEETGGTPAPVDPNAAQDNDVPVPGAITIENPDDDALIQKYLK